MAYSGTSNISFLLILSSSSCHCRCGQLDDDNNNDDDDDELVVIVACNATALSAPTPYHTTISLPLIYSNNYQCPHHTIFNTLSADTAIVCCYYFTAGFQKWICAGERGERGTGNWSVLLLLYLFTFELLSLLIIILFASTLLLLLKLFFMF